MATKDHTRVLPSKNGDGWDLKDGSKKVGTEDRKADAVKQARQISKGKGSELEIRDRQGKIQQRDSHGNDPNPPKG